MCLRYVMENKSRQEKITEMKRVGRGRAQTSILLSLLSKRCVILFGRLADTERACRVERSTGDTLRGFVLATARTALIVLPRAIRGRSCRTAPPAPAPASYASTVQISRMLNFVSSESRVLLRYVIRWFSDHSRVSDLLAPVHFPPKTEVTPCREFVNAARIL